MADPEHVAVAKSGPNAISRWREQNFFIPNTELIVYGLRTHSLGDRAAGETFEKEWIHGRAKLDLSGGYLTGVRLPRADLAHDDLSSADLTRCNMRGAELVGTNLQSAYVSRSNLSRADFTRANMTGCSLIRSDLSNSTLRVATLSGADLSHANLQYANLQDANLSNANLDSADLSWANLNGANLRGAHLHAATLTMCDLTGADLRGAYFTGTGLESSILMNARMGLTKFLNCDLSQVIGLDWARHYGPSTIALDTIARSSGMIPAAFLENAGVAAPLLAVQDAMRGVTRAYPTVLIVASEQDRHLASQLVSGLRAAQIPSWSIEADDELAVHTGGVLLEHTTYYDRIILLCTAQSLESSDASQYFARLTGAQRPEGGQVMLTVAAGQLFYQRQDHLCDTLRNGTVLDFRGWEDEVTYRDALASLVDVLSRKMW